MATGAVPWLSSCLGARCRKRVPSGHVRVLLRRTSLRFIKGVLTPRSNQRSEKYLGSSGLWLGEEDSNPH